VSTKKKILFVLGTRPEAIKLSMLIQNAPEHFSSRVCITSQHGEMLQQMLELFNIKPQYNLNVMKPGQTLEGLTAAIISGLGPVYDDYQPDVVVVQGDTTTVFAASLVAFYRKIKVAHVEAGLRTDNKWEPFPEEINRRLVSQMADWHFAPTQGAANRLLNEGISSEKVMVTGNTVVDALHYVQKSLHGGSDTIKMKLLAAGADVNHPFVLVTTHRRENFGEGLREICESLKEIAAEGMHVIFPVHLNPLVKEHVYNTLGNTPGIHLLPPLPYQQLLYLMMHCRLILSDSGGIQEEAPSFGKRVVVLRNTTERPEGIETGWLYLAGTQKERILNAYRNALKAETNKKPVNPYGDGLASDRILNFLHQNL
jgi:UDP-N-acetylglucosamine 2-epimerase (non-hydrolysing)